VTDGARPTARLYPRIPHLPGSRLGPSERHAAAAVVARMTVAAGDGDRVIVTEKLDGSCVALVGLVDGVEARGRDGGPCAASRNDGRRACAAWVEARAGRLAAAGAVPLGARLVCEWMALAHGTRYALPHGPLVAIDGFDADGARWPWARVREIAAALALPTPTELHAGGALAIDAALAALGDHGHHGAIDRAEGVMYRLEHGARVIALAKLVRLDKQDGVLLADHSGGDHVWNAWPDDGVASV